MFEWNKNVQRMLDCVEGNLTEVLTLKILTEKLNYSTYYCTKQFHKYVGIRNIAADNYFDFWSLQEKI
jgi:YesN/AraC family two-component response regulator